MCRWPYGGDDELGGSTEPTVVFTSLLHCCNDGQHELDQGSNSRIQVVGPGASLFGLLYVVCAIRFSTKCE